MAIAYIISSIILILLSFLVFRVVVRKDYLNKGRLSPVSYVLEILIFALHANFAYAFLPVDWPEVPPLPGNKIIAYSSTITIVVGLIILLYAFLNLGYQSSLGMDKNKLKINGIYQYSRNPQLVGYGIVLFGFFILYSSWYSLGWFLIYLIVSYFMVRSEEEFLKIKYREEYKEYCKSVPRVIGLFW